MLLVSLSIYEILYRFSVCFRNSIVNQNLFSRLEDDGQSEGDSSKSSNESMTEEGDQFLPKEQTEKP